MVGQGKAAVEAWRLTCLTKLFVDAKLTQQRVHRCFLNCQPCSACRWAVRRALVVASKLHRLHCFFLWDFFRFLPLPKLPSPQSLAWARHRSRFLKCFSQVRQMYSNPASPFLLGTFNTLALAMLFRFSRSIWSFCLFGALSVVLSPARLLVMDLDVCADLGVSSPRIVPVRCENGSGSSLAASSSKLSIPSPPWSGGIIGGPALLFIPNHSILHIGHLRCSRDRSCRGNSDILALDR